MCSAFPTLLLKDKNWLKAKVGNHFTRKSTPKTLDIKGKRLRFTNKDTLYKNPTSELRGSPIITVNNNDATWEV